MRQGISVTQCMLKITLAENNIKSLPTEAQNDTSSIEWFRFHASRWVWNGLKTKSSQSKKVQCFKSKIWAVDTLQLQHLFGHFFSQRHMSRVILKSLLIYWQYCLHSCLCTATRGWMHAKAYAGRGRGDGDMNRLNTITNYQKNRPVFTTLFNLNSQKAHPNLTIDDR